MDERIKIIVSDILEIDEKVVSSFDEVRKSRLERIKYEQQCKEVYTSGVLIEQIMPAGAELRYEENGKPYFINRNLTAQNKTSHEESEHISERSFSITHSSGKVICVWSDEVKVGADFESVERVISPSIVRRLCTDKEKEYYNKISSPEEANQWLLRLYTRKEAVSKLTGRGINMNFSDMNLDEYCVETKNVYGGYLSIASYK